MSVKLFRLKILKTFRSTRPVSVDLWLKMNDGTFVQVTRDREDDDLSWWGIEDGSEVFMFLHQ